MTSGAFLMLKLPVHSWDTQEQEPKHLVLHSLVRALALFTLTMFNAVELKPDFSHALYSELTTVGILKMLESGARDVQLVI
jgi:hypothetical protein